ncbi:helix-turn-helix domain-containing protein [Flavobacteriaceae bacterium TK19130]|nr:helix-turn-helix domain-containing protein [Thermobacterium salinum]
MSKFGKNIRKIRSVKTLSQQAFAELFGLKRGTLGAYEEGRSEPKIETIIKIANHFSIPIDDLLTKELTVNKLLKFKGDLAIEDSSSPTETFARVPCITPKTSGEYMHRYKDKSFLLQLPALSLPINPEKRFRGYTVENLEMGSNDKGLFPKDIVIGEVVPKNVYKKLNNGVLVLVLANNALILRRLYIAKDIATLRADHKNVEEMSIPLSDIEELWRIRYVFYHRLPDLKEGLEEKLQKLEKEFAKIRKGL